MIKHKLKLVISQRDLLPDVELLADIVHIPRGDTFTAERRTCHLLGKYKKKKIFIIIRIYPVFRM